MLSSLLPLCERERTVIVLSFEQARSREGGRENERKWALRWVERERWCYHKNNNQLFEREIEGESERELASERWIIRERVWEREEREKGSDSADAAIFHIKLLWQRWRQQQLQATTKEYEYYWFWLLF
jgi:hypothetical protein